MSKVDVKEELQCVHDLSSGDNDIKLYRRLQKQGHYWAQMFKEATDLQKSCAKCQEFLHIGNRCSSKRGEIGDNSIQISFSTNYCHQIVLMR